MELVSDDGGGREDQHVLQKDHTDGFNLTYFTLMPDSFPNKTFSDWFHPYRAAICFHLLQHRLKFHTQRLEILMNK